MPKLIVSIDGVTGATTLGNTLSVTGLITGNNGLTIASGTTTLNGPTVVNGTTTLNGSLTIALRSVAVDDRRLDYAGAPALGLHHTEPKAVHGGR